MLPCAAWVPDTIHGSLEPGHDVMTPGHMGGVTQMMQHLNSKFFLHLFDGSGVVTFPSDWCSFCTIMAQVEREQTQRQPPACEVIAVKSLPNYSSQKVNRYVTTYQKLKTH